MGVTVGSPGYSDIVAAEKILPLPLREGGGGRGYFARTLR